MIAIRDCSDIGALRELVEMTAELAAAHGRDFLIGDTRARALRDLAFQREVRIEVPDTKTCGALLDALLARYAEIDQLASLVADVTARLTQVRQESVTDAGPVDRDEAVETRLLAITLDARYVRVVVAEPGPAQVGDAIELVTAQSGLWMVTVNGAGVVMRHRRASALEASRFAAGMDPFATKDRWVPLDTVYAQTSAGSQPVEYTTAMRAGTGSIVALSTRIGADLWQTSTVFCAGVSLEELLGGGTRDA